MTDPELSAWTAARLPAFEEALGATFATAWPPRLRDACRYPLATGGKRMRPLLCFAAAEAAGGDPRRAMVPAVAVELLHTYSLVHDDLPCLDDDDERRGRPTVHVVYGEALALLAGDALLTEAFAVLATAPADQAGGLVRELAGAAGARGMIAGQAVDIGADGPIEDVTALLRLHGAKTGALIRAAVRMGAIAAGAPPATVEALDEYATAVGLAFQIHDDVLDADQDAAEGGPPSFVKLLGLDGARTAAREHADVACRALAGLPDAGALHALARRIVERSS